MYSIETQLIPRVIAALLRDPCAGTSLIEVSQDQGAVILSGKVLSEAVRQAAEELVRRQAGVKRVINNLRVVPVSLVELQYSDSI